MIITSLDNKEIKRYYKLKQKKYRDIEKLFLVEGEHLVIEANKAFLLTKVITTEDNFDYPNKIIVTEEIMKKLSSLDTPPNIIGVCKMKEEKSKLGNRVLILDDIQDPGNMGTIIRSSVAFNVDSIIVSENTVDIYNPKVVRATQGLLFYQNIIRRDLEKEIELLKKDNYYILATNVLDGTNIKDIDISNKKLALIMGNEGNGVRDCVAKLADKNIYIETNKLVESLNVGVATSILLYELENKKEFGDNNG